MTGWRYSGPTVGDLEFVLLFSPRIIFLSFGGTCHFEWFLSLFVHSFSGICRFLFLAWVGGGFFFIFSGAVWCLLFVDSSARRRRKKNGPACPLINAYAAPRARRRRKKIGPACPFARRRRKKIGPAAFLPAAGENSFGPETQPVLYAY